MMQTVSKTRKTFFSKGGRRGSCNITISNRRPSLVIPHFEGLGMKKPNEGKTKFCNHSIQNGGSKRPEVQNVHFSFYK